MHVCQINGHMAVMIRRQSLRKLYVVVIGDIATSVLLQKSDYWTNAFFAAIDSCRFLPSTLETESNAVASRMWSREMIMSTVFYLYSISTSYHKRMQDIVVCHVTADSQEWILLHDLTFYTRYSAAVTPTRLVTYNRTRLKKVIDKRTLRWKKRSEQ